MFQLRALKKTVDKTIKMTIVLISALNSPESLSKTCDLIDLIGIDLKTNKTNSLFKNSGGVEIKTPLAFYSNKLCKQNLKNRIACLKSSHQTSK